MAKGKKQRSNDKKSGVKLPNPKMTLREENAGRNHVSASTMLKMRHLQNIATWASGEGSVPCLAAVFGRRLASTAEATGVALDRSLVFCQRCETILQPGDNCTIRIEKNVIKKKKHQKSKVSFPQNNVVYTCHFCSHRNARWGTSKGHVKELLASKAKDEPAPTQPQELSLPDIKEDAAVETQTDTHAIGIGNNSMGSIGSAVLKCSNTAGTTMTYDGTPTRECPTTLGSILSIKKGSQGGSGTTNLASGGKMGTGSTRASTGGSRKRKNRKGWSSLKEIVESNERSNKQNLGSLVIPFKL